MYICNFMLLFDMHLIVDMMQPFPNAAGSRHIPDCYISD